MNERRKEKQATNEMSTWMQRRRKKNDHNNQVFVHITTQSVCFQYAHGLQRIKSTSCMNPKGTASDQKRGKRIEPSELEKKQQQQHRIRNKNRNAYWLKERWRFVVQYMRDTLSNEFDTVNKTLMYFVVAIWLNCIPHTIWFVCLFFENLFRTISVCAHCTARNVCD